MDISVAIIFKNEIRCIERCLRSIQPLKERVSCEIVMADTGSTDGSRTVAEQYADIVFDFPWINDFAAARNAVLDRCSGIWVLSMDCDEWLDVDVNELAAFVQDKTVRNFSAAGVVLRDYSTAALDLYGELLLPRLLRRGAEPYYIGAIHERPKFNGGNGECVQLLKTILHHDGYVMLNDGSEEGRKKRVRNVELLREELKKDPNDLYRLLQYIESANDEEDFLAALRRAVELVCQRSGKWQIFGAPILRHAVFFGYNYNLPELNTWIGVAKELFPQSYYTRIDVEFVCFVCAAAHSDCEGAISSGEAFLNACEEFRNDPEAYVRSDVGILQKNAPYWVQYIRIRLAEAYRESGAAERALALLEQTDWDRLDERHTRLLLEILGSMEKDGQDIQPLLLACREGLNARNDSHAEECRNLFRSLTEEERPTAELLQLAAKVKAILERFPPDDPAVIDLKNSPAYQKVAWLIEEDTV